MKRLLLFLILFISITKTICSELDNYSIKQRVHNPIWKSLSLSEVQLTDSYFKEAMYRDRTYILSLDPDRLLANVRKNVGLIPKAPSYGGWEKNNGVTYGHYMSACAMMYASTGDKRFIDKLDYMLTELKICQDNDPDGWFITNNQNKNGLKKLLDGNLFLDHPDETKQPWNFNSNGNIWYSVHKVLAGLRDALIYADREQAKPILLKLANYISYIVLNTNSDLFQSMLSVEQGGMNEVFTDLYVLTGDTQFLSVAEKFNHINVIYKIANNEDILFGRHANDQITKFSGLCHEYQYSNNEILKTAAENFWDIVRNNHTLVIGGNSCYERFGKPCEESKRLDYSSAETCNTYNMLKLSRELFMLTNDVKYLNYYERALYNHILASQDPEENGCVTYYTSLMPGLFKQYSTPFESFWCCVGTGMENHAKYGESIYFINNQNLLVNLFIPSELKSKKTGLQLKMGTKYPESDTINIKINQLGNFEGNLIVRIPDWLKVKPILYINRKMVNNPDYKNGFITINKNYITNNSSIILILHRTLRLEMAKDEPHFGSIMYGPLVLAGELGTENMPKDRVSDNLALRTEVPIKNIPMLVGDTNNLENWIIKDAKNPLKFTVLNSGEQKNLTLIPFFQLHHQRTTVYWKIYSPLEFKDRSQALTDEIIIGDSLNEFKHKLTGENQKLEWHDFFWAKNRQYRIAEDGGWFSYELKINPKEIRPYSLICSFWGDETSDHKFDIYIDNKKLKEINLDRKLYLTYVDDIIPIPVEFTAGKNFINVRFQAEKNKKAGGLYNLKITADTNYR